MNIYLFMGTHLAEIRQCLRYLSGADEQTGPVEIHVPTGLGWPEDETGAPPVKCYDTETAHWVFDPDADGSVFILLDPRTSPVPQIVRLAEDLRQCLIEPVKVLTCVDCAAAEAHQPLRAYYDACIYYSDVVLLGNRAEATKPFVREYQKQYERDCYPCLFMMLKGPGNPDHPLEVLAPDTRRLSQIFDLKENAGDDDALPGLVIEASCDLDMEEEEADPFRQHEEQESPPTHVPDASPWIIPTGNP